MDTILLVEDKAELREMLVHALTRMGFLPSPAADLESALQELRNQRFSAVLTDLKLPHGSGLNVLSAALAEDPNVPVIIMTAHGTIPDAVAAIREGAYDFIQKPIDLTHLKHLLTRAIERHQLLRENLVLKEEFASHAGFPRIIGESPAMRTVARELQRIAPTDSAVLLLGESGTGKELFARAIHRLSGRASKPLVSLNCAAIPESLIENELFGHERGAFTGADARKPGKFELAHGGTIFLDEVGELPLGAQSKLLRVLEEKVVERLGGTAVVKTDVRIVAATNRDLARAIEQQQFRGDLFYRLNVFPIHIPPLRERGEDVVALAEYFLDRFRAERNRRALRLGADAIAALRGHSWPGNVRELQNVIERACILNEGELRAADLGLAANVRSVTPAASVPPEALDGALPEVVARAVAAVEKAKIEATLRECKWSRTEAAKRLGIAYKTLLAKIQAYGLDV